MKRSSPKRSKRRRRSSEEGRKRAPSHSASEASTKFGLNGGVLLVTVGTRPGVVHAVPWAAAVRYWRHERRKPTRCSDALPPLVSIQPQTADDRGASG